MIAIGGPFSSAIMIRVPPILVTTTGATNTCWHHGCHYITVATTGDTIYLLPPRVPPILVDTTGATIYLLPPRVPPYTCCHLQIIDRDLANMLICIHHHQFTFALLPHYERVRFACATFTISWLRIRHWFPSVANVLTLQVSLVAELFPRLPAGRCLGWLVVSYVAAPASHL